MKQNYKIVNKSKYVVVIVFLKKKKKTIIKKKNKQIRIAIYKYLNAVFSSLRRILSQSRMNIFFYTT